MNNKIKKFKRKTIIVNGTERVNVGGKWVPIEMEQTAIKLGNITQEDIDRAIERGKYGIHLPRITVF